MTNATAIYLDNNATTQPAAECVDALLQALQSSYANPSSKHQAGEQAKQLIIQARAQVAKLLGATPAEIVFTSGATESNAMALYGAVAQQLEKRHIVTSCVEHPSILAVLRQLETQGVQVTYLPVDQHGQINLTDLEAAITAQTALVSLMWANNETGVIFPVEAAAQLAHAKGVLFHTDATQAVCKLNIDLAKLTMVDLLSFSGHKLHAAKGCGVLFVRKGLKLPALLPGHQERNRRGGTENVPALVSLGVACALAAEKLLTEIPRIRVLRDRLETELLARLPQARVNGSGAPRVANTSNICFTGLEGEVLLQRLDRAGIAVSAGAACSAGGNEPSHVLMAMGLEARAALASLRFSLSRYTTAAEIDRVIDVMTGIITSDCANVA
jgi:cysteine desulfurase